MDIAVESTRESNKLFNGSECLTPQQAADYLGLSPYSLASMRYRKRGPKYLKLGGRIRYFKKFLDEFIEKCIISTEI